VVVSLGGSPSRSQLLFSARPVITASAVFLEEISVFPTLRCWQSVTPFWPSLVQLPRLALRSWPCRSFQPTAFKRGLFGQPEPYSLPAQRFFSSCAFVVKQLDSVRRRHGLRVTPVCWIGGALTNPQRWGRLHGESLAVAEPAAAADAHARAAEPQAVSSPWKKSGSVGMK